MGELARDAEIDRGRGREAQGIRVVVILGADPAEIRGDLNLAGRGPAQTGGERVDRDLGEAFAVEAGGGSAAVDHAGVAEEVVGFEAERGEGLPMCAGFEAEHADEVEVLALAGVGRDDGDIGHGVVDFVGEAGEREAGVRVAEVHAEFSAGEFLGLQVRVGVGRDGTDTEGAVIFVERGDAEGFVNGGACANFGRGLPDEAGVGAEGIAVLVGIMVVTGGDAGRGSELVAVAVGVLPVVEAGAN